MPSGLPWRIYLTERAIRRLSGRLWARYMWRYWESQGFSHEELEAMTAEADETEGAEGEH